jgi:lipoprotein-anchoring transpeptidase ErfK/SrfK
MAKPDIDKQIEQIRERLVVLNREVLVCPQPTPAKKRSHTFLTLICAMLFFLIPATDTFDELGPFVSLQSSKPALAYSSDRDLDSLQALGEFADKVTLTISKSELWPLRIPSAPEVRYASSKIKLATPPAKPQYAEAVEQGPTIDQLTFQVLKQKPNTGTNAKLDTENLYVEIDDLDETIIAVVDKSDQKLHLYENGLKKHSWEVSTARKGKATPTGTWNAQWLSKYHKSSIYNNAPMPYSIFYNGNFAIHGTDQIDRLGTPASSGCVRLHPENAAVLYAMVERVGRSDFAVRVIE